MQAALRKDGDESVQNAALINNTQVQYHSSATEQDRRKFRAKAVQRAYRERKDQHLIRLNQQISAMEDLNAGLHASNEQLKLEIARIAAENELCLATCMSSFISATEERASEAALADILVEAPSLNSASDLRPSGSPYYHPVHRLTESKDGDKLLDKVAAWDMIQNHALYKAGVVDIIGVKQKLEGFAQCNGQGIAFERGRIRSAIENSVISDS
ncbi:predicted protein [Aspergillus terreus NIH2624]|uniref:BZIP domain-containing protein n=1 Tax=Aspergillus terreus (strain NIH 2624 / FGSC A1156) TaxID=341663 RepID=Q0CTZ0_ASPTN|nr:uncharacterized protein ATEG_02844 [Aspergillus terreus NIH2624]EAU36118.1 predicted protein [Aspergillus terreus NIH2624]